MLNPQTVQMALVLMNRADLKGSEAKNAAITIDAFEKLLVQMNEPQEPESTEVFDNAAELDEE